VRIIALNLRHPFSRKLFLFAALLLGVSLPVRGAPVLDVWRASDLDVLSDGDLVGSWSSVEGRVLAAAQGEEPELKKGVTPSGATVARFDSGLLSTPNSPVAGLSAFSVALVFRAESVGANDAQQWYGKSGIVDAEQPGVTADWGVVIDEQGNLGLGTGDPDSTVFHRTGTLVDGRFHVAVLRWGIGRQSIFLDEHEPVFQEPVSSRVRNSAGLSFGGIQC